MGTPILPTQQACSSCQPTKYGARDQHNPTDRCWPHNFAFFRALVSDPGGFAPIWILPKPNPYIQSQIYSKPYIYIQSQIYIFQERHRFAQIFTSTDRNRVRGRGEGRIRLGAHSKTQTHTGKTVQRHNDDTTTVCLGWVGSKRGGGRRPRGGGRLLE